MRVLFLLSRALILMVERKPNDVLTILNQTGILIDNSISNLHLKEYLKVFFFILQVCYYLVIGQVKTVKPSLKQLQQSIQTIMAPNFPTDECEFRNCLLYSATQYLISSLHQSSTARIHWKA